MRFAFLNSYDRSVSQLDKAQRERIARAVDKLIDYFEHGVITKGLGLKKLRGNYWEIRADISTRVIFLIRGDLVEFILAGNHDQIRRSLRRMQLQARLYSR